MKLILVPSNPKHGPRVAISIPEDGGEFDRFLDSLVVPALVAYGWHPQTIQDYMRSVIVSGAVDDDPAPPVDDLTERSTTPYPLLPPAPEGYSGWTNPALAPADRATVDGPMAFFHASGRDDDAEWVLASGGNYGGNFFSYPIYFAKAIPEPHAL
jgi:hypothetical protein